MENETEKAQEAVEDNDESEPKKSRTDIANLSANQTIPVTHESVKKVVPPSPPQMVSLQEIVRATEGLQNLALAHEIAVNPDFSIPESSAPPKDNSLLARVHEMMHKAFWDLLTTELAEDPPSYNQAMILLKEIKDILLDLLPKQAKSLRRNIEEKLDVELVQQQAEAGTLDFREYSRYIIDMMSKMCCPARDDDVKALNELTDIVPVFKGILEVLKKMKIDYANFAIREARPFIMAHRIQYERKKFAEVLAALPKGVDGLAGTRPWLLKHKHNIFTNNPEQTNVNTIRMKILSEAFVEALKWPVGEPFPETLAVDFQRLTQLGVKVNEMIILSTVILVTLSIVGQNLRDLAEFKQKLKEHAYILLQSEGGCINEKVISEKLPAVADQILKDISESLTKIDAQQLTETTQNLLKGQIEAIAQPNHPVRQVAEKRLLDFLKDVVASYKERKVLLPVGYSVVMNEVQKLAEQFADLVWFNMIIFSEHYCDILGLEPPIARAATPSTSASP